MSRPVFLVISSRAHLPAPPRDILSIVCLPIVICHLLTSVHSQQHENDGLDCVMLDTHPSL